MSAASCLLTEEQLLCGICLDVFTDPVTLPCGHNFCKKCISQHWNTNIQYACPTCKQAFHRRLDLRVNTFISEMAAQFRQSSQRDSKDRVVKEGEVPCDICTQVKMRAVRSCLVCLASYCEAHLKPHLTASSLKRHQLTEPVDNLEGRMCSKHDKPLELFCKTDQTCVCMLCPVLDHKSHEVVPLKVQVEKKKSELGKEETEIHRLIQQRRLKIQDLKDLVTLSNKAADREMADGVQVFTAMILALEKAQAEIIGTIEEKQKATEKQAKCYIQELEDEISDLMRRRAEVEQLSRSKDHLLFLQSFLSLNLASKSTKDWSKVSVELPSYKGTVRAAVDHMEKTFNKVKEKVQLEAMLSRVQQFTVGVTLDPDTAHAALILSDNGKQVHHGGVKKNLPENKERFSPSCCVLGKESFSSGKKYFEVGVEGKTRWTIGVAKESIKRKGVTSLCPDNGYWTIWLKNADEYAALVGSPLRLSLNSKPQKVGVLVDYDEGRVSFYDVDAASLLYSFSSCSFKGKLYPFFSPGLNDDGKNSAPLIFPAVKCVGSVKKR